eukprot:m.13723 g.13723  ORF g.13723 m.13723 type:complete len:60 (+) comp10211_c0_seq1:49-228(+)
MRCTRAFELISHDSDSMGLCQPIETFSGLRAKFLAIVPSKLLCSSNRQMPYRAPLDYWV